MAENCPISEIGMGNLDFSRQRLTMVQMYSVIATDVHGDPLFLFHCLTLSMLGNFSYFCCPNEFVQN